MTAADRIKSPGPKKILALDGGGIRGMITVEVLAQIENLLRRKLKQGPQFVLADYFDFVAGTSTGAIIAVCVSLGMKVDDIRDFYLSSGTRHVRRGVTCSSASATSSRTRSWPRKMREVFGKDTTLGSDKLRTVLMMVMRNVSTDSPWPLSNNPFAKYNQKSRSPTTAT
ncbi:MAG: patatin-like phospholipase family protein [Desulfobacterales bacterium]|nr:patatin-like phospholipase family protein [Desulfobacterales bacterium]